MTPDPPRLPLPDCLPPRAQLGLWPTPLHALPRLSKALGGPRLLIKRDDLSGRGLGGNKVRKLEYLIAAALAGGHDTVVTGGAVPDKTGYYIQPTIIRDVNDGDEILHHQSEAVKDHRSGKGLDPPLPD